MINQEKESTSPFNSVYLWKSGGKFIVKLWPHMYRLRHFNSWKSGRKGKTEKLVKVGQMVDREIFTYLKKLEIANFNSQQKV